MFVKKYVRLLLCLYPRYYVSRHDFEFCKLQQQLFSAQVAELHGGLLVLTTSLYLDDGTYAEALMLDDVAFAKGGRRRGRDWG